MIISTHGSRFYGGQIDRLDYAFRELGHEVNTDQYNVDLIYSNDPAHFSDAIYIKGFNKSAKLILNVLDVPVFLPNINLIKSEWLPKLLLADKVTCISNFTKTLLKQELDIDSTVIYNPAKNITNLNLKRTNPFIFIGRANDKGKRFNLVRETISRIQGVSNDGQEYLMVIGNENPSYGKYMGVVNDEQLNYYYNISKYMIYPAKFDGLGLPPIEAILAGVIPILCKDSETSKEFFPEELLCEPNSNSIIEKIDNITSFLPHYQSTCAQYAIKYKEQFSGKSVAARILKIYENIK